MAYGKLATPVRKMFVFVVVSFSPNFVLNSYTQTHIHTHFVNRQRNPTQSSSSTGDGIFRPQADWGNINPDRMADMNRQYNEWVTQQSSLPSYNTMVEQIYRQYYSQYMNNV